jgi:hypothetical protein
MKRILILTMLLAGLVACGPNQGEIADAIADGNVESGNDYVFDLGYQIGTLLNGLFTTVSETKYYRMTDDTEPLEQRGADYAGSGPTITETTNSSGSRAHHIIGRSLERDLPEFAQDYTYSRWLYLAEARQISNVSETVQVIEEGSTSTTITDKEFDTARVGQIAFWEVDKMIWTGHIGGDEIWPVLCDMFGNCPNRAIGKKSPVANEFWVADEVIYRVVGTENLDMIYRGDLRSLATTKIEMRYAQVSADPAVDYINSCLPWTSNGTDETDRDDIFIDLPDCPAKIIAGYQWWYQNMLVKSEITYVSLATYDGTVQITAAGDAGPLYSNDPGYGYETYQTCDHDDDDQTNNVDCRYFATSNEDTVNLIGGGGGGGDPTSLDFSDVATGDLNQYFHFSLTTVTDSWTINEIDNQPVPEGEAIFTVTE